jgi:hypothetical protein
MYYTRRECTLKRHSYQEAIRLADWLRTIYRPGSPDLCINTVPLQANLTEACLTTHDLNVVVEALLVNTFFNHLLDTSRVPVRNNA